MGATDTDAGRDADGIEGIRTENTGTADFVIIGDMAAAGNASGTPTAPFVIVCRSSDRQAGCKAPPSFIMIER